MNNMPITLRKQLSSDDFYKKCALRNHGECGGPISWEHSLYFGGRQLQEYFAIVPLCHRHHGIGIWMDAGTLDKDKNIWVALNRATDEEIQKISKVINYFRVRDNLNEKYGIYKA